MFAAGAAVLFFASCQENTTDNGLNQAQIDSAVNARVEEIRTEMLMQNDSIINAEAQRRADSMMAVAAGKPVPPAPKKVVVKPTTKPQPATATVKEEPAKSTTPTGVNDRPGGTGNTAPKNVNDRPGGNSSAAPKNVNDRPGGNR